MDISISDLKRGTEVDMPMRKGEDQTSMAIRFNKADNRFELYNFNTGEVDYSYTDLNQLLKHTNRIYGTSDTGSMAKGGEIKEKIREIENLIYEHKQDIKLLERHKKLLNRTDEEVKRDLEASYGKVKNGDDKTLKQWFGSEMAKGGEIKTPFGKFDYDHIKHFTISGEGTYEDEEEGDYFLVEIYPDDYEDLSKENAYDTYSIKEELERIIFNEDLYEVEEFDDLLEIKYEVVMNDGTFFDLDDLEIVDDEYSKGGRLAQEDAYKHHIKDLEEQEVIDEWGNKDLDEDEQEEIKAKLITLQNRIKALESANEPEQEYWEVDVDGIAFAKGGSTDKRYVIRGSGGNWYIYDTYYQHTMPTSILGLLNQFKSKAEAHSILKSFVNRHHYTPSEWKKGVYAKGGETYAEGGVVEQIYDLIARNDLDLDSGSRTLDDYYVYLDITPLVWGRNMQDGYKVNIYTEQYGEHIGTIDIDNSRMPSVVISYDKDKPEGHFFMAKGGETKGTKLNYLHSLSAGDNIMVGKDKEIVYHIQKDINKEITSDSYGSKLPYEDIRVGIKAYDEDDRSYIEDVTNQIVVPTTYAKGGEVEIIDYKKVPKPKFLYLEAQPNLDFESGWQREVKVPRYKVKINSFNEAQKLVEEFFIENELGAGNFWGGQILDIKQKEFARVSPNRRVWLSDGKEIVGFAKGGKIDSGDYWLIIDGGGAILHSTDTKAKAEKLAKTKYQGKFVKIRQGYGKGGKINRKYLDSISESKRNQILKSIAGHYGTSTKAIEKEVFDEDAEMLYEYIGNHKILREEVWNDIEFNRYAKGGSTDERWIKTDKQPPVDEGSFVAEADKRKISVEALMRKALGYPTKDDFTDEAKWESYKNSVQGKKKIELRKQAQMVKNMGNYADGGEISEPYEMTINKDNWSGEEGTIKVYPQLSEVEIEDVGRYKIEGWENKEDEFLKVYEIVDSHYDETDLKGMYIKNGNWYDFGNWNRDITRDNQNPYIALAQLCWNIY